VSASCGPQFVNCQIEKRGAVPGGPRLFFLLPREEDNVLKGISLDHLSRADRPLMAMGHGDELVIADGTFLQPALPGGSCGPTPRRSRAPGCHPGSLPLDPYVTHPVALHGSCSRRHGEDGHLGRVPADHRPARAFFPRVSSSWTICILRTYALRIRGGLATGENGDYANIILKKGLVKPENPGGK